MKKYFDNIKGLQFDQKPDYQYLKNLFQTRLNQLNSESKSPSKYHIFKIEQYCYDWCPA